MEAQVLNDTAPCEATNPAPTPAEVKAAKEAEKAAAKAAKEAEKAAKKAEKEAAKAAKEAEKAANPPAPKQSLGAFMNGLGFALANTLWSWGSVKQTPEGPVVLLKEDESLITCDPSDETKRFIPLDFPVPEGAKLSPGLRERRKHLNLAGARLFIILVKKSPTNGTTLSYSHDKAYPLTLVAAEEGNPDVVAYGLLGEPVDPASL